MFPPGRSLIVPPSQLWSRGQPAAFASAGSALPYYPAASAVDGAAGTYARSAHATDALSVDLGTARSPNVFGVLAHNIDSGLVAIFQAADDSGFGSLLFNYGAAARQPNFWIDLRGFNAGAGVTARHWRVAVNANTRALVIGEVVVGTGFAFNGVVRRQPETITFWQERARLEEGAWAVSASGSLTRSMRLDLSLMAEDLVNLQQVSDEAGLVDGRRVVIVPDTRRNDLWFVEWPETLRVKYPRSDYAEIEVSLDLVEESAGVVLV